MKPMMMVWLEAVHVMKGLQSLTKMNLTAGDYKKLISDLQTFLNDDSLNHFWIWWTNLVLIIQLLLDICKVSRRFKKQENEFLRNYQKKALDGIWPPKFHCLSHIKKKEKKNCGSLSLEMKSTQKTTISWSMKNSINNKTTFLGRKVIALNIVEYKNIYNELLKTGETFTTKY